MYDSYCRLTGERAVVGMQVVIVVGEIGVVVVLVAGQTGAGHRGPAAELLALEGVVVVPAEEPVRAQGELVAGHELAHARRAPEALEVVDLALGPHHEVVLVERQPALVALCPE